VSVLLRQPHGFEGLPPCLEELGLSAGAVAKVRVHRSHRMADGHSRSLDPPRLLGEGNDLVADLAQFVHLDSELVEVLGPHFHQPANALVPGVLGSLTPLRERVPNGVRRDVLQPALDSPRVERLVRVTHDLHGLLRHRLLLKAEVGECAFAVVVDEDLRHLAIAHVNHLRLLCRQRVQFQAAGLAAPAGVEKHEHAFDVELTASSTRPL
jgi:hypothetical protein